MKVYVVIENWWNGWDYEERQTWRYIRGLFKEERDAVDYCLYGVKTMRDGYTGEDEAPAEITVTNQESLETFSVQLRPVGSDDRWAEPSAESTLIIEVHELQ